MKIRDTPAIAQRNGCYAAHEQITPLCPYSPIYEKQLYDLWYDALASERRKGYK
jgi:hypothetical protein